MLRAVVVTAILLIAGVVSDNICPAIVVHDDFVDHSSRDALCESFPATVSESQGILGVSEVIYKSLQAELGYTHTTQPLEPTVPFKQCSGSFPDHMDHISESGRMAEDKIGLVYLSGDGKMVFTDQHTDEEYKVDVKPGRFISWNNQDFLHRLERGTLGLPRQMLGPMTLDKATGALAAVGSSVTPMWADSFGSTAEDIGYGIAVDSTGNSYLTGAFAGNMTVGSTMLTPIGNLDIFAIKLDINGSPIWAVSFGSTNNDFGYGIAVDSTGNSYLTGSFAASMTVGNTTLRTKGSSDIFAIKLGINGSPIWAVSFGGVRSDVAFGIAVDSTGNSYLTGLFAASMTVGSTTLTPKGGSDIFAIKLATANGSPVWAVRFGSGASEFGFGIGVDSTGNSYLTGSFPFSMTVGSTTLTSQGSLDVFAIKLDINGSPVWAVSFGSLYMDYGYGIAVDSTGNSYLTGNFEGSMTVGSTTLTPTGDGGDGDADIFAIQLATANGSPVWAVSFGSTNDDSGQGIAVDSTGNSYLTGFFSGNMTVGSTTLTPIGNVDIFAIKLGINGSPIWAVSFGSISTNNNIGYGIAVDSTGNSYLTGFFSGNMTVGSTILMPTGGDGDADIFAIKLRSSTGTASPTFIPTSNPTSRPTALPSTAPTTAPTATPTTAPTTMPTTAPTMAPTASPTTAPTMMPTIVLTTDPTATPTTAPTMMPTIAPTMTPTTAPTTAPSVIPTTAPTTAPSVIPTTAPTDPPTDAPTMMPTIVLTTDPTATPTIAPTTAPTVIPTTAPTDISTNAPTMMPTIVPVTDPTATPTIMPTNAPTLPPTNAPTNSPTATPINAPSTTPTTAPTNASTKLPTAAPTNAPTLTPTTLPTDASTAVFTARPTKSPTYAPSNRLTPSPTTAPTNVPTTSPSKVPSKSPTNVPSKAPTKMPSKAPSKTPTRHPSKAPTKRHTARPTKNRTTPKPTKRGNPYAD